MASVKNEGGYIKITWDKDDWFLRPDYTVGDVNTLEGSGLVSASAINPYRVYGYLYPGYQATDVSGMTNANSLIKSVVNGRPVSSVQYSYGIQNTALLHRITSATGAIDANPHTIAGTGVVGEDVIPYSYGGNDYIFYSYNDNTDGDVGRYNYGTWTTAGSFDDDFMSAAATDGAKLSTDKNPHPMIVGLDKILYIGDGNNLAAFDGSTSTFEASALDIDDGFIIRSFAKTQNFLVIFASTKVDDADQDTGMAKAYFWDMRSETYTYEFNLEASHVSAGFNWRGTVGCFVNRPSRDGKSSKVLVYNGSRFEEVVSYADELPGHGGVMVRDDSLLWNCVGFNSAANRVFSYGKVEKTQQDQLQILNILSDNDGPGALFAGSYNTLYASSGASAELQSLTSNYATASAQTAYVPFDAGLGKKARLHAVKVIFDKQVSAGSPFTLNVRGDATATTGNTRGSQTTIIDSETSRTELVEFFYTDTDADVENFPEFTNSVAVDFDWFNDNDEANGIHSVTVYLLPVEISQTT